LHSHGSIATRKGRASDRSGFHGFRNLILCLVCVAEVDPDTGTVLNTFAIGALFDVNFGDLDVCSATGHLFVVSSAEDRISELTPDGSLVGYHPLPTGVSSLSGIAIAATTGYVWVSGTGGTVWELSGFPCDLIYKDGFESGDTSR